FIADPVGVSYVRTRVDKYTTASNATYALPFWKKRAFRDAPDLTALNLTTTASYLSLSGIGHPHWATIQTFSVTNYGSQYEIEVESSDGKYLLDVVVSAGSKDLATSFAVSAAGKLDNRLHAWRSGRLHGQPVTLPDEPKQGPPASGPDPATMLLHAD